MRARRDPGGRRGAGHLAALLLAALLGAGAAAAAEAPASFFIETITVESERLSPEIVLSESLLSEGDDYTEAELRDAVHRINRLPFVLLAEFSLRKGSERGRYELVIRVYEARRWFSQIDLGIAVNDPVDRFRFGEPVDRVDSTLDDDDFDAIIGRRFAVGRRGLLFGSFGSQAGLFAFGYQRYGLGRRNMLFSVTLAGENELRTRTRSARAQLTVPIRGNHALRLLGGWNRIASDPDFFGGFEQRRSEGEVAWVFNSLDDPVLPREGLLVEAGVGWLELDDRRDLREIGGGLRRQELRDSGPRWRASAARHWPVASRQSLSAGVRGFAGESAIDGRRWEAEGVLGHQLFLLRNQQPGRWRELRLETELSGRHEELTDRLVPVGFPGSVDTWRLSTGLTYRNGWGLFRLFVAHVERSFE